MKFMRTGNIVVNLDQIAYVQIGEDQSGVNVYFAGGEHLHLQSPQSDALVAATRPMEFHDLSSPSDASGSSDVTPRT